MLERTIEQHLVKEVKRRDGLCLKMNTHTMDGIPDRIVLMPKGKIGFVSVLNRRRR